jgi:hypothetical protein
VLSSPASSTIYDDFFKIKTEDDDDEDDDAVSKNDNLRSLWQEKLGKPDRSQHILVNRT